MFSLIAGVLVFNEDDFLGFTSRSSLVANGNSLVWLETTRGTVNVFGGCSPYNTTCERGVQQITN